MERPDFRTPRLFLDADLRAGAEIVLDRDQTNYVRNVLRLPAGAAVLVFNGRDGEWRGTLREAGRRASALVLETRTRPQSPPGTLGYAFAPLKHARLDYMVQKAVEMGAASLAPVLTQHTQVTRVNVERMRANAIEAAEQCGVLAIPSVHEPVRFDRWLAALDPGSVLVFCDEAAEVKDPIAALRQAPQAAAVTLLVGPEGGFDDAERRVLLARPNVVRLSLGPRILRADTAAVAALALIQSVLPPPQ